MNSAPIEKEKCEQARKQPRVWFHWQNLNDRKDETQGSGWRHGRCWLNFRSRDRRPGPSIMFCWNFWTHFCMAGVDIDDEDLTFSIGFPPVAFWLSFSTSWRVVDRLAPKKTLAPHYPDTVVIDHRECSIHVHGGRIWLRFGGPRDEWTRLDPWWKRGISLNVNPFEWVHMRTEVRRPDGDWNPYVGSWERDKAPDQRELFKYPYIYVLKSGTIQNRMATVYVKRMSWRPKCFRWTRLFEKTRVFIDVQFNDEVGERSGSWKGGTIGCGYDMKSDETPEQCLRRMERDRKL